MQKTASNIINILRKNGHNAYLAGGCVRDLLLGIKPKDFDIATSAKPDEIEDIFEKTYPIGKQFGVIHVYLGSYHFEVATFREDRGYEDKRRPKAVRFYTDSKQDALRRDFTINALFMDPETKKIIDHVGGQIDLKERLIKFVGDPEKRLEEDSLRLLRGVRFVHQIEGQYDPNTYNAIKKYAHEIKHVSKERIRDEMNKILLLKKRAETIHDLYELGLLKYIIPELCQLKGVPQPNIYHKEGDAWDHIMRVLKSISHKPSLELVWACLLHDIAKPQTYNETEDRIRFDHHAEIGGKMTKEILTRLKFPKKFIEKVSWIVSHHMLLPLIFDMPKGRQIHWVKHPCFNLLVSLEKYDSLGTIPPELKLHKKIVNFKKKLLISIPRKTSPLLSGQDIMKISKLKQGPQIGRLKEEIYELQLEGKIRNKKEAKEKLKFLLNNSKIS